MTSDEPINFRVVHFLTILNEGETGWTSGQSAVNLSVFTLPFLDIQKVFIEISNWNEFLRYLFIFSFKNSIADWLSLLQNKLQNKLQFCRVSRVKINVFPSFIMATFDKMT